MTIRTAPNFTIAPPPRHSPTFHRPPLTNAPPPATHRRSAARHSPSPPRTATHRRPPEPPLTVAPPHRHARRHRPASHERSTRAATHQRSSALVQASRANVPTRPRDLPAPLRAFHVIIKIGHRCLAHMRRGAAHHVRSGAGRSRWSPDVTRPRNTELRDGFTRKHCQALRSRRARVEPRPPALPLRPPPRAQHLDLTEALASAPALAQ